ncbi:hypothetical protein A2334_01335 [Candidatus Roizmanbacteria bacterium RIFOXYB2_FULL_38_10]|uniref:Uncharacterized protein n=1 Tax=Candidatus Roizmanbacteria bacterium RIFOXYD1_FULL_38_12 TaxID=1802093 RepID=A0A1F7L1R5_9BACT|nr:MAG: hypothetical protein A3K47_04630 [Candidatus Roizmanbacteria bacterium RIFOXYA2_FULL_38_14]OGK64036.1 MAG: hypothetical protein A3K27_04630 [Candidatus Roizmanbacteria bacterium RIFOXYA1_FULL_37_12]OGK65882.1 MAG: hypothetical protein A3K38_04630 [Candidatus Roizmanbacteria bacterium RIFOXYB1_FULL_40_23]OGK68988.1 MAG: hypothetical protein A2334_01335 [Candidatus Roizmanbacteria bacterium RIFOXYB2_FULL_38_10]OGK70287.1 MAG: hypothetical protein A3K21_04635 [Candidatus Roizmanbacteria ba
MNIEIIHSVILIFTIGLSFLFPASLFARFDLQIAAFLFIVFFVVRKIVGDRLRSRLLESVIFTFVILLTINTTGGLHSSFFFLLYFLLFSLSLLLEPVVSITSTLALMIFFMVSLPPNQDLKTLLPIFSLAFLTPFALFMGQEFIESQRLKVKSQKLETDLEKNKEETFLFLSLMLKNHLKSIIHAIDNFMGDHELHSIKKHVRNMEKLIEKYENSQ